MSTPPPPRLLLTINLWTLIGQPTPEHEWSMAEKLEVIREAGFAAVTGGAGADPRLAEWLRANGLRFAGFFDADEPVHYAARIAECLALDDGPMNCQLGHHDTPVEAAVEKCVALMAQADEQGAQVYLEVHRDTCTETPEKTAAIAAGYRARTGRDLPLNFDFSHPAVVKHLDAGNYVERLLGPENAASLQRSNLWHFRPFNGHHCQIPITDGGGAFSPEYAELRPFVREALRIWRAGAERWQHDALWLVPELGPRSSGYGLSCFPNVWEDCIALGRDLEALWDEVGAEGR